MFGATESGRDHRWGWNEFAALPSRRVIADFHCVTKFSIPDIEWEGVPAAAVLQAVPPAAETTHVLQSPFHGECLSAAHSVIAG